MADLCVCGCGRRGRHDHHVVYQAKLRELAKAQVAAESLGRVLMVGAAKARERRLCKDRRNIVRIDFDCHGAHHNASKRLPLRVLPDSVFEFAAEVMGAGAAYEYLRRRYAGNDLRLDALLSDGAA